MKLILAASAIFALNFSSALASPFSAITATASSEFSSLYDAENTIDGSGLSSNIAIVESHESYSENNHWTTRRGDVVGAKIEWGFGTTPVDFGGIYIWNHRSNIIAANSGYEPTLFDLTLKDISGTTIISYSDIALAPDTATAQSFSPAAVVSGVGSVVFAVKATQLPTTRFTGLAEVAFDDALISGATVLAPIPLPAGLPLLMGGIGLLALARQKRA